MTRLKIAVIGVGALGRHHARILAGLDSVDLVAVAEPNAEIGQSVADSCGCGHLSDFHDLLEDVDAVTVAVPTSAHLAVAGDCLKAGLPVMVEKPIAGNLDDAALLVDPLDIDAIAGALTRLLEDADLRARLEVAARAQAATFTWERTAAATVAAYEAALGGHG